MILFARITSPRPGLCPNEGSRFGRRSAIRSDIERAEPLLNVGHLEYLDGSLGDGRRGQTDHAFPLTTMADDLARMRQDIATGCGFFLFRGLDRNSHSDNELVLIFRGFGVHFGNELTQSAFGDRLGDIRHPRDRSRRRGYQSGGFQTAHTDPSGEVGIVAMLSVKMAMSGGDCQRPHRP
jgi:hypothetical protein